MRTAVGHACTKVCNNNNNNTPVEAVGGGGSGGVESSAAAMARATLRYATTSAMAMLPHIHWVFEQLLAMLAAKNGW